jgi:hypothetical protein
MTKRNFLLGKGERLTEKVRGVTGGAVKVPPYTFTEAVNRVQPMLRKVVTGLDALSDTACPNDQAVIALTLNPEYIAKSYFPANLLRSVGLEAVGSRAKRVTPEKRSGGRQPEETITTELFLLGRRASLKEWAETLPEWKESMVGAKELAMIESLEVPAAAQKLKQVPHSNKKTVFEVVLHLDEQRGENYYLSKFREHLKSLGLVSSLDKRFYANGLCFLQVEAPASTAREIASFAFVRVVRPMPVLRMLRPAIRATNVPGSPIKLPAEGPLDSSIKVAIFDGGIPKGHFLTKWATPIDVKGIGPASTELLDHGIGVTSAFLFGHINPKHPIDRPYAGVDHYRVIDTVPGANPYELYEILERIHNVLKTSKYDFINLSLGPKLPIDDDEVHAWTAVLDEHLSNSDTLVTVAVGNDGEGDPNISANRIQVPSDCVNAMGIGACDVPDKGWQRAPYSSVGPGRNPGLTKPDLVEFGGSVQSPFLVVDSANPSQLKPTGGTSFASPSTLRMGAGIRAHFGPALSSLAIRTLLVHCAETAEMPKNEIGWGRVARTLEHAAICEDDTIRVVYQGTISPSKYIRVPIPFPNTTLTGMVTVKATLCFITEVDPHHPSNYTRSGLEPVFRPNKTIRKDPKSLHPSTKSFFGKSHHGQTEDELRRDAGKWENCLHAEHRFQGKTLNAPVFDIHYNARLESRNDLRTQELKYAMVISVKAPKVTDLYDQVVRKYATQLEALQPVVDIPVRV